MNCRCVKCTLRNAIVKQNYDVLLDTVAIWSLTEWECHQCTFKNENDRQKCEMCRADQPPGAFAEMLALQISLENGMRPIYQDGLLSEATGFSYSGDPAPGQVLPVTSSETTDVVSRQPEASVTGLQENFNEAVSSCSSDNEVRIILLGRTGDGKSATGNTILGFRFFESSPNPSSVTKTCERGTCTRCERTIQVIDTPGMYDTEMSTADVTREIVRCVGMTAPGPHVFLLVLTPGRHTEEVQKTIDHYMNIFGEGMVNYLIVLFTRKDDLSDSGKTIEDYIGKDSRKLTALLRSCNNRYVAFNNRGTDQEKEEDVNNLLNLIDEMVNVNGGVYSNDMYKEAERAMKAKEEKIKRKNEEHLERQREAYNLRLREVEQQNAETVTQLLQDLELLQRDSNGSRQESEHIQDQLRKMKDMHKQEVERMRAEMSEMQSRRPANYREAARREMADDSDSLFKELLPYMFEIVKFIPTLISLFK